MEPYDINPRIERHPIFFGLNADQLTVIRGVVQTFDPNAQLSQKDIKEKFDSVSKNQANLMIDKIRRGMETYYLAGMKYFWVLHFFGVPTLTLGGFIETPGGPLGNFLPSNLTWLCQSDSLTTTGPNGTIYRLTRPWMGGPDGHWCPDLYS